MLKNKVLSISPFDFYQRNSGVTNRIYAINTLLENRYRMTYVLRKSDNSTDKKNVLAYAKNRRESLFSFRLLHTMIKKRNSYDIILINSLWAGLYGLLLKLFTGKRLVFDDPNIEFIRFFKCRNPVGIFIYLFELLLCSFADKVFFVSLKDAKRAKKFFGTSSQKIQIVENGFFQRKKVLTNSSQSKKRFLFFGLFDYYPNKEAYYNIVNNILPRLSSSNLHDNFEILLVGSGLQRIENDDRLKYLGFVKDLRTVLKKIDAVIVPLTSGGGTRLKILESIMYGKMVLSTQMGAEGLNRNVCKNLYVAKTGDWDGFVRLMIADFEISAVPKSFFQRYRWDKIVERVEL